MLRGEGGAPLAEYMDRLPSTQRLITLDGVIYVHELPRRRRKPGRIAGPELVAEAESLASVEEDPDIADVAETQLPDVAELELAEVAAAPAEAVEAESGPESQPEAEAAPPTTAGGPFYPATPPGYAIEFGTGNLVPIYAPRTTSGMGRFRLVRS